MRGTRSARRARAALHTPRQAGARLLRQGSAGHWFRVATQAGRLHGSLYDPTIVAQHTELYLLLCAHVQAVAQLRSFLQKYVEVLDPGTTIGLLAGYGRLDELMHYARCRGDWESLLEYLLQRQEVGG